MALGSGAQRTGDEVRSRREAEGEHPDGERLAQEADRLRVPTKGQSAPAEGEWLGP
jgi:hypothetical protein